MSSKLGVDLVSDVEELKKIKMLIINILYIIQNSSKLSLFY